MRSTGMRANRAITDVVEAGSNSRLAPMQYADSLANVALQNSIGGLLLMALGGILLLVLWAAK